MFRGGCEEVIGVRVKFFRCLGLDVSGWDWIFFFVVFGRFKWEKLDFVEWGVFMSRGS